MTITVSRPTPMKIVFSRKGFDAGTGGCPSPIGPDGQLVSLPIPGASRQRYRDLDSPLGNVGTLVEELSKGKMRGRMPAHHDPDLWAGSRNRGEGWRASLGQCGIAQSHLAGQQVGVGDLLLFFGWFRPVEQREGAWSYVRGAPDQHVMFGYLQIGRSLVLGPTPKISDLAKEEAWLADHPHLMGTREANNTLHLASDELIIDGRPTGLPGGGAFSKFSPELVLSAKGQSSKSLGYLQ
jgi:hypothetical protein